MFFNIRVGFTSAKHAGNSYRFRGSGTIADIKTSSQSRKLNRADDWIVRFSHYAVQMGGKMAKSRQEILAASRDLSLQKQDAEFCARLRAAVERGRESCPIG